MYRRRGDAPPEPFAPQVKPKFIRFVFDLSGSMYRFNGLDGRLERSLEAACMVMEAFEGHGTRVVYDMVGHSGETPQLPLVSSTRPPRNDKERLQVLLRMHAHTQFCESGDNTLGAIETAVDSVTRIPDVDERIVIVLRCADWS